MVKTKKLTKRLNKLKTTQIITLGYFGFILAGAILLCFPFATKEGVWTNPLDLLFTSTSSVTGSGLVLYDTDNYWSLYGQIIILILIQGGGIGFMTLVSSLGLFIKRKINLSERKALMQSAGNFQISGIVSLVKKILKITLITEVTCALLLMIQFIPDMGVGKGIWASIFTSVAAFCTAGIDVMQGSFTSLTAYAGNWLVSSVLCIEMFIGAMGFLVIDDLFSSKFKWKKLHLHSKIVIIASNAIWIVTTLLLFLIEGDYSSGGLANALFQSISGSSTGFNSVPINEMQRTSQMVLSFLMFVGGSPGSTAGGIKTTTFVVLLFSMFNGATKSPNINIGGKTLKKNAVKQASAVFFLYIFTVFFGSSIILACHNDLTIHDVVFEAVSAIDNVGLSLGITQTFRFGASNMSWLSSIIITLLMFIGRIGPVTTISLLKSKEDEGILVAPSEDILIG